jgi:hypothetical protein
MVVAKEPRVSGFSDDKLWAVLREYSSSGDFGDAGESKIPQSHSGGFSVFPDDSVFDL